VLQSGHSFDLLGLFNFFVRGNGSPHFEQKLPNGKASGWKNVTKTACQNVSKSSNFLVLLNPANSP